MTDNQYIACKEYLKEIPGYRELLRERISAARKVRAERENIIDRAREKSYKVGFKRLGIEGSHDQTNACKANNGISKVEVRECGFSDESRGE